MNGLRFFILTLSLVVLLPISACTAGNEASALQTPSSSQTSSGMLPDSPNEGDVEALLDDLSMDFPGDAEQASVRVSDRVLDGFEAGPSHLRLDDGTVIYWGFKFQEAAAKSLVIYDATHRLRLVAVVDNLLGLTVRGEPYITDMADYRQALERSGLKPGVFVFVRKARDLRIYLPVLKRWIQADLAGLYNVDCDRAGMAQVCALATQVQVPLHAYAIEVGSHTKRTLAIPDVPAASIPLKAFTSHQ